MQFLQKFLIVCWDDLEVQILKFLSFKTFYHLMELMLFVMQKLIVSIGTLGFIYDAFSDHAWFWK